MFLMNFFYKFYLPMHWAGNFEKQTNKQNNNGNNCNMSDQIYARQ